MAIFVQRNSQRLGPYTLAEVRSQLASGALSLKDHVWWTGQEGWVPLVGSEVLKPGFEDPDPTVKKNSDEPSGLSSFSVAAVVAGLLFPMSFFTSVPSIIFGHCALIEMNKHPFLTGRRLAYVGLALGYFFTLVWCGVVGYYFYDIEKFHAIQEREDALKQVVLLPDYSTKTPAPQPATNAAPVNPAH
jgi:hypothetical protein